MNSAQIERALATLLVDLFDCDARRQTGVDAWPKPANVPESR